MRVPVPADGDYLISVRDQLKGGGPEFVYRVEITEEQLKKAPKAEPGESWEQANRGRDEQVYGYWEQPAPVCKSAKLHP